MRSSAGSERPLRQPGENQGQPTIVSVLRIYRGNVIELASKKLQDVLPRLKWEMLDLLVDFEFKTSASSAKKSDGDRFEVYRRRGGASKTKETFRLVGVFDEEAKEYHLYITGIMPEQLSAEDVALLYRARWSVELVFKEPARCSRTACIEICSKHRAVCVYIKSGQFQVKMCNYLTVMVNRSRMPWL
jgi:hypothetical protein